MGEEKVLVITYYWPPSGGAGVQRSLKFVKYLLDNKYLPIVLTVNPEKASYPVRDVSLLSEIPKEVKIIATDSFEPLNILSSFIGKKNVPYGGFANSKKEKFHQKTLRWIRGNFFIPDARVGWVKHAVKGAGKIIREEKINCILVSSPPHSSQLIGLSLKKEFPQLRWVADMRDPWTDIYYYKDLLHAAPAAKKDAAFEKQVLETADAILVVSETIKRAFVNKSVFVFPEKIHVIPNGYDEKDFPGEIETPKDKFIITYVGTMADSYRPEIFFYVLKRIVSEHPEFKVLFRFVGNVPSSVKKMTADLGLENYCEWNGHVTHEEAVMFMRKSNALLLIIPDAEGAEGILTGKLFEYLGAKRLILGLGPVQGDAAKIINDCRAGEMFHREEEERLYSTLLDVLKKWKQGESYFESNDNIKEYRRSELTKEVANILRAT